jgi:hypothetical protein
MSDAQENTNAGITNAALNRIIRYNHDRESVALKQKPHAGVVYHYTTADGLKGIIEGGVLWATSAYYLNDSTEIMYGYRLLSDVLDDWIKKNPPRGIPSTI